MFTNGWALCLLLFGVCLTPQGTDGLKCYQCSYRADMPEDSFCPKDLSWYNTGLLDEDLTCDDSDKCFVTYTLHEESNTLIFLNRGCSKDDIETSCRPYVAKGQKFYECGRSCHYNYCNSEPVDLALKASTASVQPIAALVVLLGAVAMYVYTNL